MRKVLYIVLALALFIPNIVYADTPISPDDISAKYVYAYEVDSGKVIFAKNEDTSCAEASTTKLMTALLILEGEPDLTKIYTVDEESKIKILPGDSSMLGVKLGEKMSVKDLLTGMMVVSGNDAATVLAENFAGSTTAFVDKMNERAKELGMTHTTFRNPHGLDNEQHRTTAKDFSKLATACYNTPGFIDMTKLTTYEIPETNKAPKRVCNSTNRLVRDREGEKSYSYQYANGLKTGNTSIAGFCIVASAKKDDTSIIIVMFGDESEKGLKRWPDCIKIFDYGFNNFEKLDIKPVINGISIEQPVAGANVDEEKGLTGKAVLTPEIEDDTIPYYDLKDKITDITSGGSKFKAETNFTTEFSAPLAKGTVVGTVKYTLGDYETREFPLVVSADVPQAGETSIATPTPAGAAATPGQAENKPGSSNIVIIALGILAGAAALTFGIIWFIRSRRDGNRKQSAVNLYGRLAGNFSTSVKKIAEKDWDYDFDDSYPPPDPELLSRVRRNQKTASSPLEDAPPVEPEASFTVKTAEQKIAEYIANKSPSTDAAEESAYAVNTEKELGAAVQREAPPILRSGYNAEKYVPRNQSGASSEESQGIRTLRGNKGYVRRTKR